MSDKQNERLEVVKKLRDFASKLQELSPEITKIIDDNFWELLAERNGASVEACEHTPLPADTPYTICGKCHKEMKTVVSHAGIAVNQNANTNE